jgi:hypothetical protein
MNPANKIITFIKEIGLKVTFSKLDAATFLPGIHIKEGVILVDPEKLLYPGDLLHEAGHLALLPPTERAMASGNLEPGDNKQNSLEPAVICWTWAALLYLEIDPKVVFHEAGYRGASDWYVEMYSSGNYMGLPLLQWMGLCKRHDDVSNIQPFPRMVKWIRD